MARNPFRFDLALALLGCAAVLTEAAVLDPSGHSRAVTALLGVACTLPAAWRRRDPLLVAAAFGLVVVADELSDSFLFLSATTPYLVALALQYGAGRYEEGWRTWLAAGLVAVPLALFGGDEGTVNIAWVLILFVSPVLGGRALRRRDQMQAELREKTERIEASRGQRATEAVEDERNRLAGELQAVIANGVSAMVVQAEGIPAMLRSGSAERAGEAFERIEGAGRDSLVEMRRLLGVLRSAGERPALAPQPSLARADALVAAAGDVVPVELVVGGVVRELSPGVDLAAYRVLQEALDSATSAGGVSRIEVTIHHGEREVTVSVADDRATGGPDANTLAALRERVSLYDGSLRAEPGSHGRGFLLTVELPHEAVPV